MYNVGSELRPYSGKRNPGLQHDTHFHLRSKSITEEINAINFSGVNAYLIKTGKSYFLIDTGYASKRIFLENELTRLGCQPGNLKLVVLTHGDVDHAGNSAFLREKFGTMVVMHQDDSGMVERADMGWNRKVKSDRYSFYSASSRCYRYLLIPANSRYLNLI
jgi:glyoxylase-like metal-dependent hydrolase (beta-lactamase superfamily II)